jgi:hypothetical protein
MRGAFGGSSAISRVTVSVDPYRTAIPCHPPCEGRLRAVIEERFLPAKSLGGWVWLDAPLRQMNWRVKYMHEGMPDHSGEPFVFRECVFCGGTLPEPPDDDWCIEGEDGG